MRSVVFSSRTLPLVALGFVTACSPSGGAARDRASSEAGAAADFAPLAAALAEPGLTLGTLDALIDGVARRFHVVSGRVEGTPYASATWFGSESEEVTFALGAIDTPEPDFDTFRRGSAGTISMGDYDGPALVVSATLVGPLRPRVVHLPSSDAFASVVYLSRAVFDDPTVMYMVETGAIDIASIRLTREGLQVDGTFHGTAVNPATGERVEILDGRFRVGDVPHVSEITPPRE